jgi:hypothetical protein
VYEYRVPLPENRNIYIRFEVFTAVPVPPCGGGLEYLHRSPASRKRPHKGNSVSNETVIFGLKFRLDSDLTVSTARYRSVLSSEMAPYITIQVNVRVKEI